MADIRTNGNFWRGVATSLVAIALAIASYFVRLNDQRWEQNDRHWRELESKVFNLETSLARMEEKLNSLNSKKDGK